MFDTFLGLKGQRVVGNVDSTQICAYLRKSRYVCYLTYLPNPIPTPAQDVWVGATTLGWRGAGVGWVGWGWDGASEVGEVADVARLA